MATADYSNRNRAPEYNENPRTPAATEATTEARQGVTGHNVRYVLLFSLIAVIVAFVLIYAVFSA